MHIRWIRSLQLRSSVSFLCLYFLISFVSMSMSLCFSFAFNFCSNCFDVGRLMCILQPSFSTIDFKAGLGKDCVLCVESHGG